MIPSAGRPWPPEPLAPPGLPSQAATARWHRGRITTTTHTSSDRPRETVDAGLRQVDFLDTEIAQVDQLIAADALGWPEVKRLMTVPGVNVIVAGDCPIFCV